MNFTKLIYTALLVFLLHQSSLSYAKEERLLHLEIVTQGVYPLSYLDKNTGQVTGYATKYIEDILAATDISYNIKVLPWSRAYRMALTKPNILVIAIAKTKQRESQFVWFEEIMRLEFYLRGLKTRYDEIIRSDEDYKNSVIGVIRNDFNQEEMIAQGYSHLVGAEDAENLAQLLHKGRVDFIVASNAALDVFALSNYVDKKTLFDTTHLRFLNSPIYYAFSSGTDGRIIKQMQAVSAQLNSDPDYIKQDYKTLLHHLKLK